MGRLKKKPEERPEIPISPMIDAVFLLLIYFMVATDMEKEPADISFQLPGTVEQSEPVEMPDEQIIEINAKNEVIVNDYQYDNPKKTRYIELIAMLKRFKEASDANKVDATVTVSPTDNVPHQIIIRVMDACSYAGIQAVNFSFSEEG